MEIYRVGGSVRDELLGLSWHDADWVVIGATVEQMLEAGYKPVGKDFPVFLHPTTKEEYALARTERKTGPGYKGFEVHFAPDVTLAEDLLRRDLTINAMAIDEHGELVDPHGGQVDLQARLLRHVSAAFVEDPVRILRTARFAARFGDFSVANETRQLMRQMVSNGEVDALVPERAWSEIARGLMQAHPYRMIEVLQDCDALGIVLPGLQTGEKLATALQFAADRNFALASRYALLALSLPDSIKTDRLASNIRLPVECASLAHLARNHTQTIVDAHRLDAAQLLDLIERIDALRRGPRAGLLLDAVLAWSDDQAKASVGRLNEATSAARQVDAGAVARRQASGNPSAIAKAIAGARIEAIERLTNGDGAS